MQQCNKSCIMLNYVYVISMSQTEFLSECGNDIEYMK